MRKAGGVMDDKTLFLYGHKYHADGTVIHITVNTIEARTLINTLISQLIEGETPHFTVYGQLMTTEDHLDEAQS